MNVSADLIITILISALIIGVLIMWWKGVDSVLLPGLELLWQQL